jgi:hypothetical protein
MKTASSSKRTLLKTLLMMLPAALFGQRLGAQERLSEEDQMAKILLYVHDAKEVDSSNPAASRYQPGQDCSNCVLFHNSGDEEWAPCSIFQNKLVNKNGWCNAWVLKP